MNQTVSKTIIPMGWIWLKEIV